MAEEATAETPRDESVAVLIFGGAVGLLGLVACLAPTHLASRFTDWRADGDAITRVLHGVGPALLAMAAAAWISTRSELKRDDRTAAIFGLLLVIGYLSLTRIFADWMVDDAAITFAYSKNLATGHGIVIHPGHPPEEGYSNTLWMLFLAAARWLGADIARTAKRACLVCGALVVWLTTLSTRNVPGRSTFSIAGLAAVTALGAPFIIWSSSGLEHSLQAMLFALIIAAPLWPRRQIPLIAGALSALVLTRPETPIVIVLVTAVLVFEQRSWLSVRHSLRRCWPVLVFPLFAWLALSAFRLAYFHDLLSNPYYAKAKDANWLRVLNFVGSGWSYAFGWLADARTWLLVPIVLAGPWRKGPLIYRLAATICAAQLLFVLFAGGDWMGCYRFVSPALPALAVLVVYSVAAAGARWNQASLTAARLLLIWFIGLGTVGQLVTFRAHPTTPTAVVALIGQTFVDLGHRLGIPNPSLAHHDAGGTTYAADIDLVDLGGLADRTVAKHMSDSAFIRRYLFEDRRPTFIFGASNVFAAGATQFFKMPEFDEQYVPLRFPGRPFMKADLCHVRRDAIHEAPGIRHVKDGAGEYWTID